MLLFILLNVIFVKYRSNLLFISGHLYGVPRPEEDIRQPLPNDQTCISPASSPSTSTAIMVTDTKGPLPPNWEVAYSENGEKYFIDHNSGTTQWEDPREVGPREILPEGWERVDDESHGTFYVE
ncbi:WW domain-containing protein [Ditylenchus destructor]|nr:WW domain-containing protein [Ditylenchus destructor]